MEELSVALHEGEEFELEITLFDPSGSQLASIVDRRNRGEFDACRCPDSFPYRSSDGGLERA